MTRKKTILALVFLLVAVIAIARIGKTIFPGVKPTINKVDTGYIEETIPYDAFVEANGVDTFLKSNDNIGVSLFATNLESPRGLIIDEEGRLLVSSNKNDKIIRLHDFDSTGFTEQQAILLDEQDRPHGIALHEGYLYVAEEEVVKRYIYGDTIGEPELILALPSGGRHFTRTIAIKNEKIYISVGSSCDTCIENDKRYAAVLEANLDGSDSRIFASGLRNAVFIKTNPKTGELFATEMGRDHLGDNLPPDEINIVKEDRGYGWPFCYGKQVYDEVFAGVNNCELSEPSLIDLPAHVSPLGFAFIPETWGTDYSGDLLVALHGSWNRSNPVGYSVVRYDKTANGFSEVAKPFLSGFLDDGGGALGRPVDLVFDNKGTLYMSDDKAGIVYAIRQLP